MKVLFISPYFLPTPGGLERYVYQIARTLRDTYGWSVSIVTSGDPGTGVTVDHIHGLKVYRLPTLIRISNTPINPLWYFHIGDIITREKPDIINAHSPVPFIADMGFLHHTKLPFVLTYHAGSMQKGIWFLDLLIRFYETNILPYIFRKSDAVIATSMDYLHKVIMPLNPNSCRIPPGVDTTVFKPGKKSPNPTVLYVGKLDTSALWKGVTNLIDAMSIVLQIFPDATLRLVGSGNAAEYYRDYAKSKGILQAVTITGGLSESVLVREYQRASVLVLPSQTEAESFGMVLIEAMACMTNVIGSDIGGIPHTIIRDKTGVLVPPKDPSALADAIVTLLRNRSVANRLTRAAYRSVSKDFTWEKQSAKYKDVLETVYEKHR